MPNNELELYEGELAPNAEWVHEKSAEVRIKLIHGHTESINSCQLIDNDKRIFTASDDQTARLWDFQSGKQLQVYENLHDLNIPKACVTDDSKKFVTCSWDRTVKCWDIETGKLLVKHFLWKNSHEYLSTSCGISNDSKYVVSVSDVDLLVNIWDIATGELVMSIPDLHKSTITACGFSPKNDRIVTTSMDKTTKFFDLIAKKCTISLNGHEAVISNFSYTKDERTLATCSWDKKIQIWDIATGMYRKNGPVTLTKAHEGSISSCEISQDGSICVSGGYDSRVVLWDMDHFIPKLILRGHTDWVTDVRLTADNKWIVSVGKDGEIRAWDIINRENIKQVVEQNKSLGSKLIKCSNCNRLFTIAKLERSSDASKLHCVFCRLQERRSDTSTDHHSTESRSSLITNSMF